MSDLVEIGREGEVGILTVNNPPVNALSPGVPEGIVAGVEQFEKDPAIKAIRQNLIVELWFSINPDGQSIVANWYRENLGTPYEVSPLPVLYQEYVGHDNNRDGYMLNMIESRLITKATLETEPETATPGGETKSATPLEALKELRKLGGLRHVIPDPVAWQREQRKERPLPGRN